METWDDLLFRRPPGAIERAEKILRTAGFLQADLLDLSRRFCPGACYPQFSEWEISAILCLVVDGVFVMQRRPPHTLKQESGLPLVPQKAGRETALHRQLKVEATRWLRTVHDARKIVYETPYVAGIADVATEDHRWLVECGASRPSKVWTYFQADGTEVDQLVFFNGNGITIFSGGPQLKAYRTAKRGANADIMARFAGIALGRPPKSP